MLKKILEYLKFRFSSHPIKKGKSYLCVDNRIGDFTVGKVYICEQDDYLEDDLGCSDVFGNYKEFYKCFVKYGN